MPRAPVYNPATQGTPSVEARFRAPSGPSGGEMIAAAGQRLAQSVGRYAQEQDAINDKFDQEIARAQGLQIKPELAKIATEFGALNGQSAIEASTATQERINKLREDALSNVTNPRMRGYLSAYLENDFANALTGVQSHAVKQLGVVQKANASAELSLAQDEAGLSYADRDKFNPAIEKVKAAAGRRAQLEGLGEASGAYVKEQVGAVYAGAINNALASGDVDMASAMFDAHGDEMTFEQRNSAFQRLQKPMQEREYGVIFQQATTGIPASTPGQGGTFQMPVQGKITSKFGAARGEESHSGLDIAASLGSAIRPIAGGKVTAVTEDGRAGKWVKVEHPDGTSSTYAHMGNQSVKVGDEVGPDTVLGTVGMTGRTTGPHVHLVARDSKGARVDPEKVIGGKYGEAKVAGTAEAARNYDQASVIANIKRMGLPPEKERGAIDYALGEMARSERVLADQYQDASKEASIAIARMGDKFTDVAQLSKGLRDRMDPAAIADLQTGLRERAKAAAKEAQSAAQSRRDTELGFMKYFEPERFAKLDPMKEVGRLSPSQFNSFMMDYLKANEPVPFEVTAVRSGIMSEIEFQSKMGGIKLSDADKVKVFPVMEAQLQLIQRNKPRLEKSDYAAAYQFAVRERRSGMFGGSTRNFDVLGDVPDSFANDFRKNWKGSAPPTEGQIIAGYRDWLTRRR